MAFEQIIVAVLAALCAGGLFYALAYPFLSGDVRAEKRQIAIQSNAPRDRTMQLRTRDISARRQQVANSLKELEKRQKNLAKPPLSLRIEQAGLNWSKEKFYGFCAASGVVIGCIVLYFSGNPLLALAAMFPGALGFPQWWLKFLKKRRQAKFINEFPTAIDIIVRGVKAGLPLGDCMRVVVSETPEPVKGEFREILETQAVGMPLSEAVERMSEHMGLPETNFFTIVMQIQAKSGGSLAEVLTNLSRVLRDRKKMRAKIKAMSSEAKASAGIIGSLPIIVATLVYLTSPQYIEVMWTTNTGLLLLMGCGLWMGCGIFVMRRMIQFDF
jgi:tight adherence protein B